MSLSIGILLIVIGLILGLTQSRFPTLLGNSITISIGSAVISLALGSVVGWILGWTNVRGRRIWLALLLVWTATPLIIQLSAWDALWGRLSWMSALVDVRYTRWFDGMLAVLLVHGFANVPWVALLVLMGNRWISTDLEQYSLTTQGPISTLLQVSLPRLTQLIILAGMIVAVRVFEQFEVTDVYQVRTWAEIWYLGFSLGEFQQWDAGWLPSVQQLTQVLEYPFPNSIPTKMPIMAPTAEKETAELASDPTWISLTAGVPLLLLFGTVLTLYSGLRRFMRVRETGAHYRSDRLPAPKFGTFLLVAFVAFPLAIQLGNLLIRAGVQVENGTSHWTLGSFFEMLRYSANDYWDAAVWSLLIGVVSAWIVCSLGFILSWIVRRRRGLRSCLFLVAILLFTLPSPLVSLHTYRMINLSDFGSIRQLAATSIFAPVVALSIKYLGLSIGLWMVVLSRESVEREDLLTLSGLGIFAKFFHFGIRRYWVSGLGFGFFFWVLGAGDLSTTFATVPPGMDTFARRILGDLHAGAGAQVAAACLLQMLVIGTFSLLTMSLVSSDLHSESQV